MFPLRSMTLSPCTWRCSLLRCCKRYSLSDFGFLVGTSGSIIFIAGVDFPHQEYRSMAKNIRDPYYDTVATNEVNHVRGYIDEMSVLHLISLKTGILTLTTTACGSQTIHNRALCPQWVHLQHWYNNT